MVGFTGQVFATANSLTLSGLCRIWVFVCLCPRPGSLLLFSQSLISSAGSYTADVQKLMAAQYTWGVPFLIKEQCLSM